MSAQFCNYTIEGELGRGGMAVVYRAVNSRGEVVALKTMLPRWVNDITARRRFAREAELRLNHRNIVQIQDSGECNHIPYFAMQLIEGESLENVLRRTGWLTLPQLLPILRDVAAGLDYAHSQGVIHRDIKPSNILIRARDGRAYLTDFGVAKDVGAVQLTTITGQRIGTFQYMSPEQARGSPILTKASDVYALGILVYRALCGRVPFDAENDLVIARMQTQDAPPDMRRLNPAISSQVSGAVMRALNKDPMRRYSSAGEFFQALENASVAPPSAAPLLWVVVAIAVLMAGVIGLNLFAKGNDPQPATSLTVATSISSGVIQSTSYVPVVQATSTLIGVSRAATQSPTASYATAVPVATAMRVLTPINARASTSTPQPTLPTIPASLPSDKGTAIIYSPSNGSILSNEWMDVTGVAKCNYAEIEYWKFEFDGGAFIARFTPGMFSGNTLMHWKIASIIPLIGNGGTGRVHLVVVCKDGNVITSPYVTYTFYN